MRKAKTKNSKKTKNKTIKGYTFSYLNSGDKK